MMTKKLLTILSMLLMTLGAFAHEAYRDANVRITFIDEGTIRLEYAPDGKFVDNKSFVAVCREYAPVAVAVKENAKQVTLSTSKLTLTYKKGTGAFTKDNLKISAKKSLGMQFTWVPGTEQKGNLKGTYRTLDGYDGEYYQYGDEKRPMPIEDGIVATDGWTLLDDSEGLLFDGSEDWDWVTERKSAEGAQDWYFMAYGHDYKGALQSYTKFAGRVPLPPRYAFGYWWSRYWSYSDQDFRNLIGNFQQYDIPVDVLVIDMDWHPISEAAGGGWTGWDWNESLFPDYKKFLKYLDEQGVKATMNLHPADGVRPFEHKYQEFIQRAGIKDGENIEWQGSNKRYVKALFDTYLHPYIDEGVDFWWLDWQQWLNDKKIPQLSNTFWCNYIWFTDMERYGDKRPMLYHRWGGLGNHRYQVGFSGDSYITWESLKFLPYFNSTASNVLYGYWSHDIGGHQNHKWDTPVEPQLYTRAMQMGEYLPIIRSHSTKNPYLNKEPWAFAQDTQQRLMNVIYGRYALVPYIYAMARKGYETGLSLCRPLYYDSPEAKEAYSFREEYMFGDDMLIAPVVKEVDKEDGFARMEVWLPEGDWFEYETGTMLKGGKTYTRAFTMDEYPVYVKAGAIIPYYGKIKNLSGNDQPVIVRVFPGGNGDDFEMYEDNGEDNKYINEYATTPLSYSRTGNTLTVKIGQRKGQYKDMPAKRHFSLALPCQIAPEKVTLNGKSVEFTYDGLNLETMVDLGDIDCAAGATVSVEFADYAAEFDLTSGMKAKLHHIQTAIADHKQVDAGMVYTEALGYLEATPLRLSYHPEAQKQTIEKFNSYYSNLPVVLMQQTSNEEHRARFLRLLNEDTNMKVNELPASCFKTADGKVGFDMKFWNNIELNGTPDATAQWETVNFATYGSVAEGIKDGHFSVRAESEFSVDESGEVLFVVTGDDGYRMYVDGKLILTDWAPHYPTTSSALVYAEAGKKHKVCVEYYDTDNEALLKVVAIRPEK